MKIQGLLLLTAAVLLLAVRVLSHDYWLKPEVFFVPVNGHTDVRLYVGDEFKIEEERVLQKERTVYFQMFSLNQTMDLLSAGAEGQSPAAHLKFGAAGNYLIAMERKPTLIKLEAAKFREYLTEEGLDAINQIREQAGETNKEGRERYSRYLKSLIQVGARHDDSYKRMLGQRLEIVPQANPYQVKKGGVLRVRIVFEGQPLSGAKVFGLQRSEDEIHQQATRTASDGTAEFKIDRTGQWLIRLVHMRRCTVDCGEADWESFWGSYSFGVR